MATLLSSHTCLPKLNAQQSVALLSSLTVTQLVLLVRVRPLLFLSSSSLCCCCCCCQRFVSQSIPRRRGGRVHSGSGVNSMQIKHLRRALQFAKKYLLCFSLPLTVTKPMTSTIHTPTHTHAYIRIQWPPVNRFMAFTYSASFPAAFPFWLPTYFAAVVVCCCQCCCWWNVVAVRIKRECQQVELTINTPCPSPTSYSSCSSLSSLNKIMKMFCLFLGRKEKWKIVVE